MQRSTRYLAVRERGERERERKLLEFVCNCVERRVHPPTHPPSSAIKKATTKTFKVEKSKDIIISWSREKVVRINNVRVLRQKTVQQLVIAYRKLLRRSALIICPLVRACTAKRVRACVPFLVSPVERKPGFYQLFQPMQIQFSRKIARPSAVKRPSEHMD